MTKKYPKMPDSVRLMRKGRMVGSDDLRAAVNVLKWAEEEGLNTTALTVAKAAATGLEAAIRFSTANRHHDAAAQAGTVLYSIRKNERVSSLKVRCRDGESRKIQKVVEWFVGVHSRISKEIAMALEAEELAMEAQKQKDIEEYCFGEFLQEVKVA